MFVFRCKYFSLQIRLFIQMYSYLSIYPFHYFFIDLCIPPIQILTYLFIYFSICLFAFIFICILVYSLFSLFLPWYPLSLCNDLFIINTYTMFNHLLIDLISSFIHSYAHTSIHILYNLSPYLL